MAKRFTDTDKWKKSLLRSMPAVYKLLWLYVCDDCDHAGIWHVDIEVAAMRIGEELKKSEAEKYLKEKIVVFDGGEKWFIPGFIEFQYGELNPQNRAHQSVIKVLTKYNLSPLQGATEGAKDMDKEKDKELDMDKDFGKSENLLAPMMVKAFKETFTNYPINKERDYPAAVQISYKIAESNGWSKNDVTGSKKDETLKFWEQIVHYAAADKWYSTRSISDFNNEWQRLIQSINGNSKTTKTGNSGNLREQVNKAFASRSS